MGEEVEVLEHHADIATNFIDLPEVFRQFYSIDEDAAFLEYLQPVDAADHRRFARAGWTADDDALAAPHHQIDVPEHVKIAVPFVDCIDLYCSLAIQLRWLKIKHCRSAPR